jgi:phosphate transport system protein
MSDIRSGFHSELDGIRADTVRLAAMVTERIPWGTEVLLGNDLAAAQSLIDADDVLDVLSIEIEERCYQALVLQAPMAGDLRAIVTALRLVSELERSGDLMVNVAKAMRRLYGVDIDPKLRGLISRMADEAQRLMKVAIDSYAEGDAGKAAALDDMDDRLDQLHKDYIQAIFECHRSGTVDLEAGVQYALVGRYYERIGDHAVNIGERVRYMVTGWLPEHTGAARAAARGDAPADADAAADASAEGAGGSSGGGADGASAGSPDDAADAGS